MRYCATRTEPDGAYFEIVEAGSIDEAETICERKGWRLDGELVMSIPASEITAQQMDEMCARRNAGLAHDA